MSKVTIAGDVNGTGVFTIAAPNGNTNRTLTLPDEAGTIDTLQRAGNVLQVVQVATTTEVSTAGSDVSIGLSQAITVRANSKVFALANYCWYNDGSGSTWSNAGTGRLFQNGVGVAFTEHNGTTTAEAASWQNTLAYTTAALSAGTYTFEIKHSRTIGGTHICMRAGRQGTLILMEIAA